MGPSPMQTRMQVVLHELNLQIKTIFSIADRLIL